MEPQFWIDSWAKGGSCTSFHRHDIHPYFTKYATPEFLAGRRVLVPLCGKTIDLLWFQQHAEHVVGIELADRASLVALPLAMRLRYVAKIDELTRRGTVQFINTVQYDPVMQAPPFSVGPDEIERYYSGRYRIEHVERPELPHHGMVRKFNLNWLIEHGFVLTRIDQ